MARVGMLMNIDGLIRLAFIGGRGRGACSSDGALLQ